MMQTAALLFMLTGLWQDMTPKAKAESFKVPYRISKTQHIVVRAKINNSPPLNFVVDTGAPSFFIAEEAAKKAGIKPNANGWSIIDDLTFEGKLRAKKVKARIETPFQLKGMNGLALAGMELHGMIGYSILAKYEIHIDAKKDYMTWTPLDWTPPEPQGFTGSGKKNSQPPHLELLGSLMQGLGGIAGTRGGQPSKIRGFTGLVLEQRDKAVMVSSILLESPGAIAGIQKGDEVIKIGDMTIHDLQEANNLFGTFAAPETIDITIKRQNEIRKISIKTAFGI